jgi:hypothetical protein
VRLDFPFVALPQRAAAFLERPVARHRETGHPPGSAHPANDLSPRVGPGHALMFE